MLALAQGGVGARARGRFQLQLGGVALHHLIQVQVFVGHREVGAEGRGPAPVFLAERGGAGRAHEVHPAVQVVQVAHRQAEEGAGARVQGRPGQGGQQRLAALQQQGLARMHQGARQAQVVGGVLRQQGGVEALGRQVAHAALVAFEQAQRQRVGAQDAGGSLQEAGSQAFDLALAHQLQAHRLERGQARVQLASGCGATVRNLFRTGRGGGGRGGWSHGGERRLGRGARQRAGQHQFGIHGLHDGVGVGRLAQHAFDAAAARHGQGLALGVDCGIEDDAGGGQLAVGAQALHELVAVHLRHQDVGDDQVGAVGAHQVERGGAVVRLEQAVFGKAEQGQQIGAVARPVVNDEDGGHQ